MLLLVLHDSPCTLLIVPRYRGSSGLPIRLTEKGVNGHALGLRRLLLLLSPSPSPSTALQVAAPLSGKLHHGPNCYCSDASSLPHTVITTTTSVSDPHKGMILVLRPALLSPPPPPPFPQSDVHVSLTDGLLPSGPVGGNVSSTWVLMSFSSSG